MFYFYTIICIIILALCETLAFLFLNKRAKKISEEHDKWRLKDIERRKMQIGFITMVGVTFCALVAVIYTLLN